jgi:hypothetical protein
MRGLGRGLGGRRSEGGVWWKLELECSCCYLLARGILALSHVGCGAEECC